MTIPVLFASPDAVTLETFGTPRFIALWLYPDGRSSLWRHWDSPWVEGMQTGDNLAVFRPDTLQDHLEWASDDTQNDGGKK